MIVDDAMIKGECRTVARKRKEVSDTDERKIRKGQA